MKLSVFLEDRAGLTGRKLDLALKACDEHVVESVHDLQKMLNDKEAFKETFPQTTIRLEISNALTQMPAEDRISTRARATKLDDATQANPSTKPSTDVAATAEAGQDLPEGKR